MKIERYRVAGFCLYFAAYFLPAIAEPGKSLRALLVGQSSLPGYECAFLSIYWSLVGVVDLGWRSAEGAKLFFSLLFPGLVNPLLLVYLVLALRQRARRARQVLAVLILVLMISSAAPLILMAMIPVAGFYFWVAGIVLMIWPDLRVAVIRTRDRFARQNMIQP